MIFFSTLLMFTVFFHTTILRFIERLPNKLLRFWISLTTFFSLPNDKSVFFSVLISVTVRSGWIVHSISYSKVNIARSLPSNHYFLQSFRSFYLHNYCFHRTVLFLSEYTLLFFFLRCLIAKFQDLFYSRNSLTLKQIFIDESSSYFDNIIENIKVVKLRAHAELRVATVITSVAIVLELAVS